jgi:hypothetical protein
MEKIKWINKEEGYSTPLSAENLNKMQDYIEQAINEEVGNLRSKLNTDFFRKNIFPIGAIYTTIENVNPEKYFGGKWTAFAKGKTLFGVDTADNQFATVEKTGGKKTHTHATKDHVLTIEEMPKHIHRDFMITPDGDRIADGFMSYNFAKGKYYPPTQETGGSKAHNHGNTESADNLPPYITVYFWKRTA